LESKLEEIQKRLESTQNKYEVLKKKYKMLLEKLFKSREKYKKTALLLTDYLDELLNSSDNVLSSDQDMHLNLDEIKESKVPIKELEAKDKIALILVLLKQLQPYLSDYTPEHPAAIELASDMNVETDTADTLNRILNNIKVQTKRSEVGSRETGSRGGKKKFGKEEPEEFRLPPINKRHQ
jgi:seryl-tRNA synthetase